MEKEKVYFDTFVFMDILSGRQDLVKKMENFIKNNNGVVSSILLTELSYHLRRKKGKEKMEQVIFYIQSLPNLEIVSVNEEIATLAGRLRAKYRKKIEKKLTYFDCIHLATAISMNCKKFITGDRGFKEIKEIETEIY
jgi:predicted nucleic acid-binding protein